MRPKKKILKVVVWHYVYCHGLIWASSRAYKSVYLKTDTAIV